MITGIVAGVVSIVLVTSLFIFFMNKLFDWKRLSVFTLAILIPYVLVFSVAGYPRPEWSMMNQDMRIVSVVFDENKAIYIWAMPKDSTIPVAITFPWSNSRANALIQMQIQSETTGSGIMIKEGPEGEPMFYEEPIQDNPPKQ